MITFESKDLCIDFNRDTGSMIKVSSRVPYTHLWIDVTSEYRRLLTQALMTAEDVRTDDQHYFVETLEACFEEARLNAVQEEIERETHFKSGDYDEDRFEKEGA